MPFRPETNVIKVNPKALWRRYILALCLIASLLVISHIGSAGALMHSADDASLVNVSGRQRMLSQRILLLASRIEMGQDVRGKLSEAVDTFSTSHEWLLERSHRGPSVEAAYFQPVDGVSLDELSRQYIEDARILISSGPEGNSEALARLDDAGRKGLLGRLDNAVSAFQRYADRKIFRLRMIEMVSFGAAMLTIFFEALMIFWPAQKQVRRSLSSMETALEQRRLAIDRLVRFTAVAADLFWETDIEGRIVFMGGRLLPDLAFDTTEFIGKYYYDVIDFSPAVQLTMQRALESTSPYEGLVGDFTDHKGRRYKISLAAEPYYDGAGALLGYRGVGDDITQQVLEQEKMRGLAEKDALTGLANRYVFTRRLQQQITVSLAVGKNVALLALDLDGFKAVNDTYGHDVGDRLLKSVAERLDKLLGQKGWAARLGGDEFVVVCKGAFGDAAIEALARQINKVVGAPHQFEDISVTVGTSIGIAFAPRDARNMDGLAKCADRALYKAKKEGRGCYRFYDAQMAEASQRIHEVEMHFREALETDAIGVVYEPVINLETGQPVAFEALARWQDDKLGNVPPSEFVAVAESLGLIRELGEQVLRKACHDAASWPRTAGGSLPRLSVNISPSHFLDASLTRMVESVLRETRLHPSRLELEITDSLLLDNMDDVVTTLHDLKRLGVGISIDDFGTGYSSLNRLRMLQLNRIKIDRAITADIADDRSSLKIVRGVIRLASDLGIAVVAEGVESERQVSLLEAAGCTEAQGFYFSKSLSNASALKMMSADLPSFRKTRQAG